MPNRGKISGTVEALQVKEILTGTEQLDYTAAVLPVTHVDMLFDDLPDSFRLQNLNGVARGAYQHYDEAKMHGLPVGVQVVGRRLEEEKVLAWCERIEEALKVAGRPYHLLELD